MVIIMAKKAETNKDEQIGYHKGALSTLAKGPTRTFNGLDMLKVFPTFSQHV